MAVLNSIFTIIYCENITVDKCLNSRHATEWEIAKEMYFPSRM